MGFFSTTEWSAGKRLNVLPQCGKCGLYKKCKSPKMKPTGRGRWKILFVGEAPGAEEDERGTQLVGKPGQFLRKALRECGVELDHCWKTNSIICRPPRNVVDDLYIDCCRPNLLNTIRTLKPNVIVPLGASAVKSLIAEEWGGDIGPIGRWVGWQIPSAKYGAWICPTYHPSFVLRSGEDPLLVKLVTDHLRRAVELEKEPVGEPLLPRLKERCQLLSSEAMRRKLDWLNGQEGTLAFDYETTGLKPESEEQKIICCSFCLNGEETFAGPIDALNANALSSVLKNPRLKKVASNLKFEERWTRAKLGHGVAGWHWDTMLAAHVYDNRPQICSVKFQAYVLLGIGDYSSHIAPYLNTGQKGGNALNRIGEIPATDLLKYNALDAIIEDRVMRRQKELFGWKSFR